MAADRVDLWIAQSNTAQKRNTKYYGVDSTIIYPPVDLSKYSPSNNTADNYFLIVSRLEPYKRIDIAVKAITKIKRPLVVIGEGSDLNNLKQAAGKNIKFLGWQNDDTVIHYMKQARALILSGEEDFGLTPVEAMACGRPVVVYKRGGATETVLENKTGVFFDSDTPESLIGAIEILDTIYAKISPLECRKQAEKFSQEIFLNNLESFVHKSWENFRIK